MKCPTRLINSISNWLYVREAKFIIDDESMIERTLYKGLPQGAGLSPLLYNIYTNSITRKLSKQISQVQFVDDIAIWNSSNRFDNRKMEIEKAIVVMHLELSEIGLDLQPNKTNLVDFGKIGLTNNIGTIKCLNENLRIKKETKFLCITFDNRLQFDSQCRRIKEKVIRANSLNTLTR